MSERLDDRTVAEIAAQIACRLLSDYEPQDRDQDELVARHAVRLARLLITEVAKTEEKPTP